jgi:hypothetical protein
MTLTVPVALVLSLAFGPGLSAERNQSNAASAATDDITKDRVDERVRITTSDRRQIVGWIDRIDEHTLRLTRTRGPAVTMSRNAIARIERPNGKPSRGRSACFGYLIGAALGPFGSVAGAVVGALLPHQRWMTVPLSSVAP